MDDFDLLEGIMSQVPALVVLVFLVVLFLRHLKEDRESRISHETAWQTRLEAIGDNCHEHSMQMMNKAAEGQRDSTTVIRENTRVIEQMAATIHAMQLRQELDRDRQQTAAESPRHTVGSMS